MNRENDSELYKDAFEEAQRLIRISDEIKMSVETVAPAPESSSEADSNDKQKHEKLTTSKIAKNMGLRTKELNKLLIQKSLVIEDGENLKLTDSGKAIGAEEKSGRFGDYILWPASLDIRD